MTTTPMPTAATSSTSKSVPAAPARTIPRLPMVAVLIVSVLIGCRGGVPAGTIPAEGLPLNPALPAPSDAWERPGDGVPAAFREAAPTRAAAADYWRLSLPEALAIALETSSVLRDAGGRVVRSPDAVPTQFDRDIAFYHPRFGVEAALSDFDAQWSNRLFWNNNHRATNDLGGFANGIQSDNQVRFESRWTKPTYHGGEWFAGYTNRHATENASNPRFLSYWQSGWEVGYRQRLLRGGGRDYNLIAGNSAIQDLLLGNGLWIAQIDTQKSAVELRLALTQFVSELEAAYWELALSYRLLSSRVAARRTALGTLAAARQREAAGLPGGDAASVAFAEEQVYTFHGEVQDALLAETGVYAAERRLRQLMGLPAQDGRLILPTDPPPAAPLRFDPSRLEEEAIAYRDELVRQRLQVERRSLQLRAAENFLWPQLDLVARSRVNGFGDDWLGEGPQFASAAQTVLDGDFVDYELGLEFSVPLGFRQARSGVRHAQLQLARARAVLAEQQHQVLHEVHAAGQAVQRAETVRETQRKRVASARQRARALQQSLLAERTTISDVLEANQRVAEAESDHFRARIDHALALSRLHHAKGTLLASHGVACGAGPPAQLAMTWDGQPDETSPLPPELASPAQLDAQRRLPQLPDADRLETPSAAQHAPRGDRVRRLPRGTQDDTAPVAKQGRSAPSPDPRHAAVGAARRNRSSTLTRRLPATRTVRPLPPID